MMISKELRARELLDKGGGKQSLPGYTLRVKNGYNYKFKFTNNKNW